MCQPLHPPGHGNMHPVPAVGIYFPGKLNSNCSLCHPALECRWPPQDPQTLPSSPCPSTGSDRVFPQTVTPSLPFPAGLCCSGLGGVTDWSLLSFCIRVNSTHPLIPNIVLSTIFDCRLAVLTITEALWTEHPAILRTKSQHLQN